MMCWKIFLELNPQTENTSAETTFTEQDNGVCYKADKYPGKIFIPFENRYYQKSDGANKFIIYVLQESLYMSPLSCLCFWWIYIYKPCGNLSKI